MWKQRSVPFPLCVPQLPLNGSHKVKAELWLFYCRKIVSTVSWIFGCYLTSVTCQGDGQAYSALEHLEERTTLQHAVLSEGCNLIYMLREVP